MLHLIQLCMNIVSAPVELPLSSRSSGHIINLKKIVYRILFTNAGV